MHPEPISVLMPVRNGALTVGQALSDIAVGLDPGDEILVVNDGSEDDTQKVLANYAAQDSRLRVIETAGVGLVGALNLGLQETTNPWIARADADDRYPADRFVHQRRAINRDVALVTGDYALTLPSGGTTLLPCALGSPFVALSLINPQRLPHPGVLLRREAVLTAGGYRVEEFPTEDVGLWIRLAAVGDFVGVPACVLNWTMSPGSVSHSHQEVQRMSTRRLLGSWRPNLLDQVDGDAIRIELARYNMSTFSRRRSLLLLRDLHSWRRKGVRIAGYRELVNDTLRHFGPSLSAGWGLRRDARARSRGRVGLSRVSPRP